MVKTDGDHKYIVGYVTAISEEYKSSVTPRYVLYSAPLSYHSDIADKFEEKYLQRGEKLKVLGNTAVAGPINFSLTTLNLQVAVLLQLTGKRKH